MITVVFATRNRATLLREVLRSYEKLVSPAGGWRLTVVDNGSTDTTGAILDSFRAKLPLTVLREPRPGKNAALNAAIGRPDALRFIEGPIVVFTDDDTFPWPHWLVEWGRAAECHEEASVFGGRIVPRWESPPPEWVLRSVPKGPVFTLTEPSIHVEGPISAGLIYGPNMAVRSAIFAEGFRFNESMGPNGTTNYAMGDETEFNRRLVAAGYKTWYCNGAVVEHFIRTEQLNIDWILRRAIPFARGEYRLATSVSYRPMPLWFGIPRYLYRQILVNGVRLVPAVFRGDEGSRFRARWDFNFSLGLAIEARNLTRGQTRRTI